MKLRAKDLRCFDNGGKTCDRYTIVPPRWARQFREIAPHMWTCIAASEQPYSPHGVGQHTACMVGPHLGKRVPFDSLPPDVHRFARDAFIDEPEGDA